MLARKVTLAFETFPPGGEVYAHWFGRRVLLAHSVQRPYDVQYIDRVRYRTYIRAASSASLLRMSKAGIISYRETKNDMFHGRWIDCVVLPLDT